MASETVQRAALWIRISTDPQDEQTQLELMRSWAVARGWDVTRELVVVESAWKGKHHPKLQELYDGANRGEFDLVAMRALDRVSRMGVLDTLQIWQRLEDLGVQLYSYQEAYISELSGMPAMRELLVAIIAATNKAYSDKISVNTRAALKAKKAAGVRLGRPPGRGDRGRRRTDGYHGNKNWRGRDQ